MKRRSWESGMGHPKRNTNSSQWSQLFKNFWFLAGMILVIGLFAVVFWWLNKG